MLQEDWERIAYTERIYLMEEEEEINKITMKELRNSLLPAKIVVKGIKKEELYDKEFFNISEIN